MVYLKILLILEKIVSFTFQNFSLIKSSNSENKEKVNYKI